MKRLIILLFSLAIVIMVSVSCDRKEMLYDGPEYVMFADTLSQYAVTSSEGNKIDVVVSSTVSCDYDRKFAIEVVDNGSTAVEGVHYKLSSNTVLIKAGELAGNIAVIGNYDKFEPDDSLGVVLRLVSSDDVKWDMYGDKTKVVFMKSCPFSVDDFVSDGGNYIFYATFPYSGTTKFLVKAEKLDDERLKFIGLFQEKFDVVMRFYSDDPFDPSVEVLEQQAIPTSNYGLVTIVSSDIAPSYFYSCQKIISLYLVAFVEGVGQFGTYRYLLEWIPEKQAEEIRNNGFPGGNF